MSDSIPSRRLRLLHVTPTYLPAVRYGGPIWSVHNLCRALVRRGHEVHVATTSVDGPDDLDVCVDRPVDMDGVHVHYFNAGVLRRINLSWAMRRYLLEAVPTVDFVHLHSIFLWPTNAAARVAESRGVPWCVAPRGSLVPELIRRKSRALKSAWLALFERQTIRNAAFLHVTSERERHDVAGFPWVTTKVRVIPNGIDSAAAVVERPATSGRHLMFLGRISWKKGLDRAIRALVELPGVRFSIVGNDEEGLTPSLKALATSLGVAERADFLGPLYGEGKLQLLRSADMLLLPSYSENFGNVVLEALREAVPVATTKEVGASEVVERSGGGIVIPGDPSLMAVALRAALADPEALRAKGLKGRDYVLATCTWDAVAELAENCYLEAIAERTKGAA